MIRINDSKSKTLLKPVVLVSVFLLFAASGFGQQQINLTAGFSTYTAADGSVLPMWGYSCGAAVTGSTATCVPLNAYTPAATNSSAAAIGALGGIYVVNGGSGYSSTTPPSVTIAPNQATAPTTAAVATAVVEGGQVVGINLTTSGAGYTAAPTVTIAAPTTGTTATAAAGPGWSPVLITIPTGAAGGLTINLTNQLSFSTGTATTPTNIPTSIVIVGQVGGGLGTARTTTLSPSHANAQGCPTWFIASGATPPGVPCAAQQPGASGNPPVQGARVQSLATEVAAVAPSSTTAPTPTALSWAVLKPGTYLIESGTHPSIQVPMGLIGMLVVTTAPGTTAGTAYPASATQAAVPYNAEVPLELSEIDPVQNKEVDQAVRTAGFLETTVWSKMTGDVVAGLSLTAAGSGYTSAPTVTISGGGGAGATATATLSTTTPGTVASVTLTSGGAGYTSTPTVMITGGGGTGATATAGFALPGCGIAHTCYPPAVNYTPFYYLINGLGFNKTNPALSLFPATAGVNATTGVPVTTGITGTVLVRVVNAGLRMHTPSIVNSVTQGFSGNGTPNTTVQGFTLIAEDGNVVPLVAPAGATTVPAAPKVQTDVLMVPSKVYDLLVNVPAAVVGATPALAFYSRDLALSANASVRDAGMLAYIGVNGAALPISAGSGGLFATALARPDTYNSIAPCAMTATSCNPFTVTNVAKGVIANDSNVFGVELSSAPSNGTVTCPAWSVVEGTTVQGICPDGTFSYTPNVGTFTATGFTDQFGYCANGAAPGNATLCTTVTLGTSSVYGMVPVANSVTFTARTASFLKIASPGVLAAATDPKGLPLSLVVTSVTPSAGLTVVADAKGGFTAQLASPATTTSGPITATFTYQVQNSLGELSATHTATNGMGIATIIFPVPSNLNVTVVDAQAFNNCNGVGSCITGLTQITDYRWIIEEDRTFWVDPNCTTNSSATTAGNGCPQVVSGGTIPTFGTNFHTSTMPFIAQGCTGPLSCEFGQTMLDTAPLCTTPPSTANPAGIPAGCSTTAGQHIPAVCDLGNGACRPDPGDGTTSGGFAWVNPSQVALDPGKRYYISVLPGDAANPFPTYSGPPGCSTITGAQGTNPCGHTMSGAPIPPACNILGGTINPCPTTAGATPPAFAAVRVLALPTPLPTGKLSVIVFEDDYPLNGEQDGGGGNGTVAPIEPGLAGFNIVLWDTYGGLGDVTGQDTYDMFNEPLSNSLAGTIDPATLLDACPISATPSVATGAGGTITGNGAGPAPASGMTGTIVTCPKFESDGQTLSPLAGQAVIANLMPEKFSVQAYPGADRIARGEQWLQTNTLDGQHPHDSFIRIGEPSYFQEYGPAGYHVSIGFANPAIINARHDDVCAGMGTPGSVGTCNNTIDGQVDVQRISRTPDQRLYPSGSRDALTWTQCWVSLGDPDGEDFMFTKCDANGNFRFTNVPGGDWRLTIGDQWNDQIIDGLSTPANVGCLSNAPNGTINSTTCPGGQTLHLGNIGVQQWQSNLYTRTFIDDNKNGIWDPGEIGIPLIYARIYYRDGHNSNGLSTDFNGIANFNETFPLFNWYVVEADSTRYKRTGTHTVYDAGGPADGSASCGNGTTARQCGTSGAYNFLSNTFEAVPLPADLSVPGAVYCRTADCAAEAASFAAGTPITSSSTVSTGRIDPPWVSSEGWSGLTSHSNWIDFGMAPYAPNENGGIHGQVTYASTRPFDDASQMILQPWEPLAAGVTILLYQEGFAADGVTPTLTLVDQTVTSSWDTWAQGFYPGSSVGSGQLKPYMNCPGQGTTTGANADLFFLTLYNQPNYLDWYNSLHATGTPAPQALPYNSQYKCYDAMHIGNQIQPAPYDGEFSFPSSTGINPTTGRSLGTNCTVCIANPDSTDPYRFGTPMLPPGKYVAQVIMPPGYEVYKEEDKNLLIGDNYIAPVTQQFGGLGTDIFIIPDQASVASLYDESAAGYNPNNYQDQTTALGLNDELSGVPGYPGFQDPVWPCVGEQRVVPDYLSLYPQVHEVAPFAGATRPLCDRKEVTLGNQMNVRMHFAIFTSTHIASKFAGVITDDFTSEFDPFSPQFGEKFAPPNMPVSTKDYLGNEISRVYTDHWGTYNGLTFSSWEVNPPNITGYSPTIMVQCMNDPGPVLDTNPTSPTYGQMINDPLYNPAYSDFCYEEPYMPGLTNYTDTPVVPTQAFVGAGYNNVDCSYPDTTPAIKEVDGDNIGPWVAAANHTLTITALGDQQVTNYAYSGPSATMAPFNQKTVKHHYGFGATAGTVTVGGVPLANVSWSDTTITGTVQLSATIGTQTVSVPRCVVQQQAQYQGTLPTGQSATARCGQLLITAANGKQSIDTVTVTIGGKTPIHVSAQSSVQAAIDAAMPGDLLMIDPTCTTGTGTAATAVPCTTTGASKSGSSHTEMLIMWKPVRLQGVGAVSSIINANAQPAGKLLDPWRRHLNCYFGLTIQGVPVTATSGKGSYDSTGAFSCPDNDNGVAWYGWSGVPNNPQIDRLPLEATVGWDATQNGNLAEQLQEPSLMGAYEGAGITVLAKGVEFHGANPWTDGNEGGAFPTGTTLLSGFGPDPGNTEGEGGGLATGDSNSFCHTGTYSATGAFTITSQTNPYPSNFNCNPSSVDGLTITNSSQGGGGIFLHGWAHYIQVANDRIYNNAGTLTGGISIGQGEFPTPYVFGGAANAAPGSCSDGTGFVTNQHLPYCLQLQVNVHNNFITNNSSLGDELFAGTLSGGGGVTFCTGNDYYKFNNNWVCGNLSSGEGGGLVHLGEIQNGNIEHNSFVFNQSQNPTIPTNGGAIQVMGTPDTDPTCGTAIDADCPPGLSDGTGHGLTINANLIQGNMSESGSGGGIRLQQVNGTDVSTFNNRPELWNDVRITNNIIVNNVAGWDGGGISLQDALNVTIRNNTIVSNDTLASSGVLTQSIGSPDSSAPPGSCVQPGPTGPTSASCPQSAGVTSTLNSGLLTTTFTGLTIECPDGQPNCQAFSNPRFENNIIWGNRAFYIGISGAGTGTQNQQNLISLYNAFTGTLAPSQAATGACSTGVSYWDIGVRGDTGPSNHGSGQRLRPRWSVLDDPADYPGGFNLGSNPAVVNQYCNGSRVPPECISADGCAGPNGYGVPPGIVDAQAPNPVFSLTPSATVDEGNNWVNVSWGPLSVTNPSATGTDGNFGGGPLLGNYALTAASPAVDYIPRTISHPTLDFFGNPRPDPARPNCFDVGAVEFPGVSTSPAGCSAPAPTLASITPSSGIRGTSIAVTLSGNNLLGPNALRFFVTGTTTPARGITVTNLAAVPTDPTTATATLTLSATATLGALDAVFVGSSGTSAPLVGAFTVVTPTVSQSGPASDMRGVTSLPGALTITGTGLYGATAVSFTTGTGPGCGGGGGFSGITVTGITVTPDGTMLTATYAITNTAPLQTYYVRVNTPGGCTPAVAGVTFTVLGPTVTAITPTTGTHGTTINGVTITGSGLTGATAICFPASTFGGCATGGITVSNIVVAPGGAQLTATFTLGAVPATPIRYVTVQTPNGTTPVNTAVTFQVQ